MTTTTLDPYLIFNGNCRQAMDFYAKTLGGKVEMMMTHGESPMKDQCPESHRDQVMHSAVSVAGRMIMASDTMPGQPYDGIRNASIALSFPTVAEGTATFKALAEGGSIFMDLTPTFWADAFGMCTDKFGMSWMVVGGPKQF